MNGYDFNKTTCRSDGTSAPDPHTYNLWSTSRFFQVSFGFGAMSFSQAKTVDVVWDICFGRGGQAILTYVSWRVFSGYITTSMKVRPVTFYTYRTIFLQSEALILAIPLLIRDFVWRHSLTSKAAMIFMIATMVLVLIFPSFGSAMTGYTPNLKAFIAEEENTSVAFESFEIVLFTLHDGNRINYTNEYHFGLSGTGYNGEPSMQESYALRSAKGSTDLMQIYNYVKNYSISQGVMHDEPSWFGNVLIPPPHLNISAFWIPDLDFSGDTNEHFKPTEEFKNRSRILWQSPKHKLYTISNIVAKGQCQTIETYQWGFSYLQLNLLMACVLTWTVGMCWMWFITNLRKKAWDCKDVAREHKAVLELAIAMNHGLQNSVTALSVIEQLPPESQLRDKIGKDLGGGSISYALPTSEYEAVTVIDFLRKELVWIFIYTLLFGIMLTAAALVYFAFWGLFGLTVSFTLGAIIGTRAKSRGLLIFIFSIFLGVIPQTLFWLKGSSWENKVRNKILQ
ncbi:hypothetical protein IQ07DRAFT_649718 [Pyrenochaeta sp. DS3sAY3a]|nr:hypothetical protein IQ07DRAFT_649718 [Pyrenochaeta sp. DS3sAY3a]